MKEAGDMDSQSATTLFWLLCLGFFVGFPAGTFILLNFFKSRLLSRAALGISALFGVVTMLLGVWILWISENNLVEDMGVLLLSGVFYLVASIAWRSVRSL